MTTETDPQTEVTAAKKGILVPLLMGIILALVGGGGAFWAATSGPLVGILTNSDDSSSTDNTEHGGVHQETHQSDDGEGSNNQVYVEVAFLPLDTVTVSLGSQAAHRHLIFTSQIEVTPEHLEHVTSVKPRILDVLNSYLRLVSVDDLSDPTSLARIRSQMLHRIQIVSGEGRVRDLLITEFLVN